MITYKKGNLLETSDSVIVHGVNCQGRMGSGVAKAIRDKWPEVYEEYEARCKEAYREREILLGNILISDTKDGKQVVNLFSQNNYGYDGLRYVSYDALDNGFDRISDEYSCMTQISMPKIGAGLGGGNWEVIAAIINHRFRAFDVTIWEL